MSTSKNIKKTIKEINEIKKSAIPTSLFLGIFASIIPYINVIMLAKIVSILLTTLSVKTLLIYTIITVAANFLTFVINSQLSELCGEHYWKLAFAEQHKINAILFALDYKQLENTEFESLVRKYKEGIDNQNGHLCFLVHLIKQLAYNICRTIIALILIAPLLKFAFVTTGTTFVGSPWFIIALIGFIAVAGIVIFIFQKYYNKVQMQTQDKLLQISKTLSYYTDSLRDYKNGKEIRLFNMQDMITQDASDNLMTTGASLMKQSAKKSGISLSFTTLVGVVVAFGVYVFIGLKGLAGAFDISSLVLYSGSFLILVQSIIGLVGVISSIPWLNKTLRYYLDIIDTPMPKEGCVTDIGDDFVIEFRNVSFSYNNDNNYALRNINVTINKGQKIAIVGKNGSGKTTFIKLLSQLYSDYEGEILINGIDLKTVNQETFRKKLSIVFQDYQYFSLPIVENITASDSYNISAVELASNKAGLTEYVKGQAHEFLCHLGKDYVEDGVDISGGESQKLAGARAFYKESECLILDEPTAALDPIAEADFYKKFHQYSQDKTVLYISHRLSSCVFCEKVLVFELGELVQNGTHQELLANTDSNYYELWDAQVKYYI